MRQWPLMEFQTKARRLARTRGDAIIRSMIAPDSSENEQMKYGILGGEQVGVADKLAQSKGEVSWGYLAPHQRSGALYFVDPSLALEDVGLAFSNNERDRVDAWLKSGDLVKLEALHAAQWEGTETRFEALVVSPFVLCRPV